MWDWATQPFATVITTFVFGVYITSKAFGDKDQLSINYGWAMAGVGVIIALLAPVLGQGSDRSGRRMRNLLITTMLLAVISASLYLVAPDPGYFWLGVALLGVGNVVAEIANVNYYAAIDQVSTPDNVGRVSGLGWGMGYLGGIIIMLLIVALFGTDLGPDEIRISMILCGVWTVAFSIPIFLFIRDRKPRPKVSRVGPLGSYRELFRSIQDLWRTSRQTLYFLIASAIFRDGLAGVFTFGAILAGGTFGFTFGEVVIFGVVANIVAGISTAVFGILDDRFGPKRVIMASLIAMILAGFAIYLMHAQGKTVFWVLGLVLTMFVGPAQAASRSFLARLVPAGQSGEVFGLYATTGRAISFLSSTAWAVSISVAVWRTGLDKESAQYAGILGIVLVLLLGLLVLIPIRDPKPADAAAAAE
ncbi:MFS transporter [Tessaracoccus sp. OH4464_COT-324]|nr:MFS transporter [Tessaracoccus sp. OH4464_COT-324]